MLVRWRLDKPYDTLRSSRGMGFLKRTFRVSERAPAFRYCVSYPRRKGSDDFLILKSFCSKTNKFQIFSSSCNAREAPNNSDSTSKILIYLLTEEGRLSSG